MSGGRARRLQPRRGAAAFLLVCGGDRAVQRHRQARAVVRHGPLGRRDGDLGQPARRDAHAGNAGARPRRRPARTHRQQCHATRARLHRGDQHPVRRARTRRRSRSAPPPTRRKWRRSPPRIRRTPRRPCSTRSRSSPPRRRRIRRTRSSSRRPRILEKVFATQPDHPGITHYLIHSYDVPKLADKGLAAARRYAAIAPDAPHALHMPSHIFTRVGAWQDSIDSNKASAAAAKKANSAAEELHAMDYQVYANLQLARDDEAKRLLAETEVDPRARRRRQRLRPRRLLRRQRDPGPGRARARRLGRSGEAHRPPGIVPAHRGDDVVRQSDRRRAQPAAADAARAASPSWRRSAMRSSPKNEAYWAGQVEIQRKAAEGAIRFHERAAQVRPRRRPCASSRKPPTPRMRPRRVR